ncbi:hypothetical protein [Chryseobacterium sp. FH2]|uniref:hypothetical protein n=1 Tax=Chryseobacterium sp. FH2 TaxID=1674291 RepID=UPI000A45D475|nr:hypothetical protein [Chryseobacterium sp. FH2]
MKLKFLIFFLISSNLFCQKIIWSENQKLIWDNFKSGTNRHGRTDVVAYTNCGIQYSVIKSSDPKIPVKLTIEAVFTEDNPGKMQKGLVIMFFCMSKNILILLKYLQENSAKRQQKKSELRVNLINTSKLFIPKH